jgi:fibronectin-binding autotransporter adhesin
MKRYLIALLICLSSVCNAGLNDEFFDRYFSISSYVNANGYWNGNSGNWESTGIWIGGVPARGLDATAFMTNNITADKIVTNDVDRILGAIVFTDVTTASHNLTITGPGVLTMDVSSGYPYANVTDASRTLTISCPIAGTDGFGKYGAGILTLTGTNTFTGNMYINAGTVLITSENHLGNVDNDINFAGTSTLLMNTATPITFSANKNVDIASGITATFSSGFGAKTFPGLLTGSGNITWATTTSLTFNNTNNTFTGSLNINQDNAGYGFEVASLGDSGLVNLGSSTSAGGLRFLGRTGTTTWSNRQFALTGTTGTGYIR